MPAQVKLVETGNRYPEIRVVMLDAMAALAGPTANPDHGRAWRAAFDMVVRATLEGRADAELAAAA